MKISSNHRHVLRRFRDHPELKKSATYLLASSTGFGIALIQSFSLAFFTTIPFFGKITLLISLFSTLYVIFTLGMNAVIMRYYFDQSYLADRRRLISNVAVIWFLSGIILVGVIITLGYKLVLVDRLLPLNYQKEFIPVVVGAFLYSCSEIFSTFFVAQERPLAYASMLVGSRLAVFLLLHFSIFFFGETSEQLALMLLFSGSICFVACTIVLRLYSIQTINSKDFKEILKYAFPLMIYALGGIGYSHGYRIIISTALTYQDLATFTMANQIAMVYYLTAASCLVGFQPKAYQALEEQKGHPNAIAFYGRILLTIGGGLLILILPAAFIFFEFFKQGSFFPAFQVTPILMFGQFIYFLYGYCYILLTYHKQTQMLTVSMIGGVTTSLILVAVLLRESSIITAAIPVVCGILVQFLLSIALLRKMVRRASLKHL